MAASTILATGPFAVGGAQAEYVDQEKVELVGASFDPIKNAYFKTESGKDKWKKNKKRGTVLQAPGKFQPLEALKSIDKMIVMGAAADPKLLAAAAHATSGRRTIWCRSVCAGAKRQAERCGIWFRYGCQVRACVRLRLGSI